MARRHGKTKADQIRQWAADHPGAAYPDIIAGLGAEGVKIAAGNIVSALKVKANGHAKQNGSVALVPASLVEITRSVIATERFAERMGGIANARRAIDCLEQATTEA
jgi:hypothetical protein